MIKNQNQDIKSPEQNHDHWASSDVMQNDVISDYVILSIDYDDATQGRKFKYEKKILSTMWFELTTSD